VSDAIGPPPSKLDYIRVWSDLGLTVALFVGAFAGFVFGWRAGALIAVLALAASLVLHVVNGLVEYRRVMRRPWPSVPALEDDDDD
jgi:hypothetical protein